MARLAKGTPESEGLHDYALSRAHKVKPQVLHGDEDGQASKHHQVQYRHKLYRIILATNGPYA
jgi:hypothetical protein